MALNFQYNKTFLHQLTKDLKIRATALPTLQAKEAALRVEIKAAKAEVQKIEQELERRLHELSAMERLWPEFSFELLSVSKIKVGVKKIAGVKTPFLDAVEFQVAPYSLFNSPAWLPAGMELLKAVLMLQVKRELAGKKVAVLEYARKKTTQKVNLYEKVQIPDYRNAIRRIKRFLEDEETLAKSSQKILKEKMLATGAA